MLDVSLIIVVYMHSPIACTCVCTHECTALVVAVAVAVAAEWLGEYLFNQRLTICLFRLAESKCGRCAAHCVHVVIHCVATSIDLKGVAKKVF